MSKTLRLLMPQWQGGNNPAYSFGAQLLAWLAPTRENILQVEVPVAPYSNTKLSTEDGVVGRSVLLQQLNDARHIIDQYQPEKVIVFGGDCLVSQASFSYLNEKYNGNLGVLWLDAHPDISTPDMYYHEHAMVLGNLLGGGDPLFSAKVQVPLKPERIMYGGLCKTTDEETELIHGLGLRKATPNELMESSDSILEWITRENIQHIAIHLDLDVLDPVQFRSLLFAQPDGTMIDSAHGEMNLSQIARIIQDVAKQANIVGLSIAEYLPWDAINLYNFLAELPVWE